MGPLWIDCRPAEETVEPAGSSIVVGVPLIRGFARRNRDDLTVLHVYLDSLHRKPLWAPRTVDSDRDDSRHYFVPIEGDDGTLDACSSRNPATFCEGGAPRARVDEGGTIFLEIDRPIYKLADRIRPDGAP